METFRDDTARAEAIERAKQFEELAFLDSLTGIGNRRFSEFALAERLAESKRYSWSFALLFIDVDNFKAINDQHGHALGDQVLRAVARTLQGVARAHDFVGRWGGEEFVMIVTGADRARSRAGGRARSLARGAVRASHRAGEIDVTVSIGAATVRRRTPSRR